MDAEHYDADAWVQSVQSLTQPLVQHLKRLLKAGNFKRAEQPEKQSQHKQTMSQYPPTGAFWKLLNTQKTTRNHLLGGPGQESCAKKPSPSPCPRRRQNSVGAEVSRSLSKNCPVTVQDMEANGKTWLLKGCGLVKVGETMRIIK